MQVGGNPRCVPRAVDGVAPPPTGTVIYADPGVGGYGRRDLTQVRGGPTETRFQDDRGAARAGAMKVQPVPTHVDPLAGHGIGPGVKVRAYGVVATTYGGHYEHAQYRVQQPPCSSAAQLSSGPDDHPNNQGKQGRRPHPAGHIPPSVGPK